jgi:hypothetical protein
VVVSQKARRLLVRAFCFQLIGLQQDTQKVSGVDTLNVREYISDTRDRAQLRKKLRIYWKQENLYFKT